MKKSKYINAEAPNRAKDTEFSKFRALMARLDYEISQRGSIKKERKETPKRHKRDDDHTEDLRGVN